MSTLRTTLGLLGAFLLIEATASAVAATEHRTKRHRAYVRESVPPESARTPSNAFVSPDHNAFGTITPQEWTTGIQADDWRQSVNGR